jgi:hypothetical protein
MKREDPRRVAVGIAAGRGDPRRECLSGAASAITDCNAYVTCSHFFSPCTGVA